LEGPSAQADTVAEIILRVRPDILLLQKFDRDPAHRALTAFARRLNVGVAGLEGLDYPFLYQGPVNAGIPSAQRIRPRAQRAVLFERVQVLRT
jgi:hypothetical protein